MNRVKIVVAAVLVVLLIVLMVQNRSEVVTRLLFAEVKMAQSILLLLTATLGFGAGSLVTWFLLRRNQKKKALQP
ncbi:MAG: LapA family protein [Verrucomicrobiae bacterium]|nr:LapA family protein [Verrucomicrobiae bacterium]MCP5520012.1 LapA family protein [Verrucomicrobiales bacterium]